MEFSVFAADGRLNLNMEVYNPVGLADADKVRPLMKSAPNQEHEAEGAQATWRHGDTAQFDRDQTAGR